MTITPDPRVTLLLLAITLTAPASRRLHAQRSAPSPVVLALADSLPIANAVGAVLFRSPPTRQHVILLRARDARPEFIGSALALLRRLDAAHRDDTQSAVIPIAAAIPASASAAPNLEVYRALLHRVEAQPPTYLGDAGRGRWMEIGPTPPRQ